MLVCEAGPRVVDCSRSGPLLYYCTALVLDPSSYCMLNLAVVSKYSTYTIEWRREMQELDA